MHRQISCETFSTSELAAHIGAMRQPTRDLAGSRNLIAFYDGEEADVRYLPAPSVSDDAGYAAAFAQDAAEEVEFRADRLVWVERMEGVSIRIGRRAVRDGNGWKVQSFLIGA